MTTQTNWLDESNAEEMRDKVISLAVMNGEHMTVGVTKLEPGHETHLHSHENEQIACILSGTIDFHVEGEVHRLSEGDILHVPSDAKHYGEVVGDEPVINLDAWYPKRVPGT